MSATFTRRVRKFLLWTEIILILVLGAGMGIALGVIYQFNKMLPPDAALDRYRAPLPTKIYSADSVLLAKIAVENREPVELDRVPKHMQDAIVAIEDARFWQHGGLDFRGLARAVVTNVSGGEMAQGGSTITQQLARNMFLSSRKTISRKLKEILLAVQIERNWTKKEILKAYLNQVYFGAGAHGVKAAAQAYFNKDIKDVSLEEAAMLAALVQRPSYLSPYAALARDGNYDRTRKRRDAVLTRMADLGFITRAQAEKGKERPIRVAKERPKATGYFRAKYFVQYVVDQLREQMRYDQDILEKAGLTVVTTLNYRMQKLAEEVARDELLKIRRSRRVSEAALVCMDPHTGCIRAMVGGVNEPWEKYQFNCATQARRQPGSSFKGIVYAAALEKGDTPYSSVSAVATPVRMPDGKWYQPKNHGHYNGGMSYTSAFAASANGAAVNVFMRTGPAKVVELAKRMGLTGTLYKYPSTALGTTDASPLEMATVYGVFAAGGRRATPFAIAQVKSADGELLEHFEPELSKPILKASTVAGMNVLTRAVVTGGTGRAASVVPDAHGKTGTSEEYTDAWFCGYTPHLVTVVWAGNRDNSPMARVYGATICTPIWAKFMKDAITLNPDKKDRKLLETPVAERRRRPKPDEPDANAPPASADSNDRNLIRVTICTESGMLARDGCPNTLTEEYLLGDQPMGRCPIHTGARPPKEGTGEPPAVDKPGLPPQENGDR